MKPGLAIALLSCGTVSAWAWMRGTEAPCVKAEVADPRVETAALVELPLEAVAARVQLSAEPLVFGPTELPALASPIVGAVIPSPAEATLRARRYFHAMVNVEELQSALPGEWDPAIHTRAAFPGYYAAVDGRDALGARVAQLGPRSTDEPLPFIDVRAGGLDFERIYGSWSREDMLLERWLLTRAMEAEARRELDQRLSHGPYEVRLHDAARIWG